jgi:2-keto-4-pentenoate hydratase
MALGSLKLAVAECFPAIEVAGRRVQPSVPITQSTVIADLCFAAAVVKGALIPGWRDLDLRAIPVSADVDGTLVASGDGSLVLGHPLAALLWLAEALAAQGRALKKDDIVITGSCTGIAPITPGQRVEARFGHLPPVRLDVT